MLPTHADQWESPSLQPAQPQAIEEAQRWPLGRYEAQQNSGYASYASSNKRDRATEAHADFNDEVWDQLNARSESFNHSLAALADCTQL